MEGETSSVADSGCGVYGLAPAPTGSSATGVGGKYDGEADGATGVVGEAAAAAESTTFGVHGMTAGGGTDASGVRGQAITATSTETYGVRGSSASTGGYSVYLERQQDGWRSRGDRDTRRVGTVGTANVAPEAVTTAIIDAGTTIDRGKLETNSISTSVDSGDTTSYSTSGEETVFGRARILLSGSPLPRPG